jgi:sodium transport system permease protein
MKQTLTIAHKELIDAIRDRRALTSFLMYSWMGPAVILLVSAALKGKPSGDPRLVLTGMISVFALVSAFTGGMAVAMDVLAGERERRSLLPLLINPVSRGQILAGKWLAVCVFAVAGVLANAAGFALVCSLAGIRLASSLPGFVGVMVFGLVPLAAFAAALELAISTMCRTVKEAHNYLSMLMFLPMGVGMFLVFYPAAGATSFHFLPVLGQQWALEHWLRGGEIHAWQALLVGLVTVICAGCVLIEAANRLQRDEVVYGE